MREPDAEIDQWAHRVIGAAIEVHRELGPGFLESVYEEAMAFEMGERGIPFERQFPINAVYKGREVGKGCLDFLVGGRLVVELKAIETVPPVQVARVISYLKAMNQPLALLINFNVPILKEGLRRIVLS
jgi:GxxExxY protein